MKFTITGGTGFIGSYLLQFLSRQPHEIVILTRGPSRVSTVHASVVRYVQWNADGAGTWTKEIEHSDVVINLAGKNVFESRWNEHVKQEILNSRVIPARSIVAAIAQSEHKPRILLSVSAVGFYGDRNSEVITEESSGGNDFLADVVQQWELAAYEAEQYGVRVATPRIGLVLQKSGGVLGKMLLPFQCFVGGPIGSGGQFLPWIHMDDVVRGMLYPVANEKFYGAYNVVSPNPVTMKEFCSTLGSVLHRPSWLPVPQFALTLLYGEGANAILSGQNAAPQKLLKAGYQFTFRDLRAALQNILR